VTVRTLKQQIRSISLYGKKSAHGVNVSLTCTELNNTGRRHEPGEVVRVDGLTENEAYCFAVAAWDAREEVSGGIGETGVTVPALLPLVPYQIASRAAKIALQLGEPGLAEQAALIPISHYTLRSGRVDKAHQFADSRVHQLTLDEDKLRYVSVIEVKALAESLVVMAHVLFRKVQEARGHLPAQRVRLDTINYLLLAARLSHALEKPPSSLVQLLVQASSHMN
jgi:hypothetical protein